MFTPSNPIKATILLLLLSNRMSLIANMNLVTLDCQIVSKYLAIHGCQIKSDNLATKNSKFIQRCWWHHADIIKPKARGYMLHTVLCLLKTYLKPNIRWKHGFNSCDKGLTQEMVATTAVVTSTMQIVEYHVKYSTTTDQTHLKQTTVMVGAKGKPKKRGYHCSYKYYLKHRVRVLLDHGHNRHPVLLPRQTHAVSLLK
jgi:hypothetical protein